MYQLETFGGLALANGGRSRIAAHRRRLAFLTLVAAAGERGISRDKVLAFLWPETGENQARHNLEQLVYAIRSQLGEAVFGGTNPINLNPTVIGSDVDLFRQALSRGDRLGAVELYRGPFLDGFHLGDAPEFERWVDEERVELARQYRGALEQLAKDAEAEGRTRDAVDWWRRLVTVDPYATSFTLALMNALAATGETAEALDRARVHKRLIQTDLEAEPPADLDALAERIRTSGGDLHPVSERAHGTTAPAPTSGAIPIPDDHAVKSAAPVRRSRRTVAVLLAVTLPGILWLAHKTAAYTVSPTTDRMSVPTLLVPFRISSADSSLRYLGDGVVDLLVPRLTGEGGMAVVTSREDSAARTGASARERARRLSAGQILEGEVIRSGRSGLVVNATLKPLGHDGAGIAASAMGSVDSLPQILDRLAAALLARAGGEDERHVGRLAQVSLPALKLYLAGRAAYRRGDYDAAVARLQGAIAAEPFALAALELADAAGERFRLRPVEPALSTYGWPAEMDSIWLGGIELARASEATLDGADRAYLDLLAGPRFPQGTPAIEQLTAWERASERWPERAEIWLHFGELLLYGGPSAGIEDSRTRAAAAFQRARQANPELAGPLLGLIEIAAFDRDSSAVEHLGSAFLTRDSVSGWADYVRWRVASVVDTQSLAVLREKFDSLDSGRLGRIQWTAQVDGPAALDADRAAAILHHRASNFTERQVACVETTHLRINEGRPAAALAAIDDFRTLDDRLYCNPVLWVYYGMYWDGDTTRAAQVAEELRTYYTAWRAGGEEPDPGGMLALAQWDLWHGDTALAARVLPWFLKTSQAADAGYIRGNLLAAMLDAVRGSPEAIELAMKADSVARLGCCEAPHWADPALARIWERLGDVPRALQAARRGEWFFAPEYLSSSLRTDARLSALTGDHDFALRAYRRLAALQSAPEPRYAARSLHVTEELARLERRQH